MRPLISIELPISPPVLLLSLRFADMTLPYSTLRTFDRGVSSSFARSQYDAAHASSGQLPAFESSSHDMTNQHWRSCKSHSMLIIAWRILVRIGLDGFVHSAISAAWTSSLTCTLLISPFSYSILSQLLRLRHAGDFKPFTILRISMAQPVGKQLAEHGTQIFFYNNIRTNQVIYSLTRTLNVRLLSLYTFPLLNSVLKIMLNLSSRTPHL